MATSVKWADGNAIVADTVLRWGDGDIYDYKYQAAAEGGFVLTASIKMYFGDSVIGRAYHGSHLFWGDNP
jgi:hypothetical protein